MPVESLRGFAQDDHAAAFDAFRASAAALRDGAPALREAHPPSDALRRVQAAALARPKPSSAAEARRFFGSAFEARRVGAAGSGFLTGYYEPVVEGSLSPRPSFTAPLLRRSPNVARIGPGVAETPFLDRAAIEAAIGTPGFEPVVWLRDWVEVFFVHVQGSARVRLPDGRTLRLIYDGRNGHAYTSIGALLVAQGEIDRDAMTLDRLKGWVRSHGQENGDTGRRLLQSNRSYIFFRAEADRPGEGPIGGAGIPLVPLRSLAVDRTLWSYGLPFFVEADLPWRGETPEPFARLMIAQDTGSAILGAARADLFFGSGAVAGERAGAIRHRATFTVLVPRDGAGA